MKKGTEMGLHHARNKIHHKLKKHSPAAVRKIKKLFKFKYHKLVILAIMVVLAYFIFSRPFVLDLIKSLDQFSYIGVFLAGALTAFGFTAPIGVGLLITLSSENIWLAALVAGFGAAIVDLLIFKTIKFSFMDEFKELEKTKVIHEIETIVKNNKHIMLKHYLLYIFAGITIATPLPDEVGVSMLAGLTTIKPIRFAILCFFLHTIFMLFMLMI